MEVIRIEGPDGFGPWSSFALYKLEPIWIELGDRIPLPKDDFEEVKDCTWNSVAVDKLCNILSGQAKFGFPSIEAFEKTVGEHRAAVLPYVKVYETEEFILSKSRVQVIFTKGVYKSNLVTYNL